MYLHRRIHVAFLGVGLATAAKIQQSIEQAITNPEHLVWTNINDPHMDVLVVDRAFQDAHSVRKVLPYRPVPVLAVERQMTIAAQLIDDVLYLPIHQPKVIAEWLYQRIQKTVFDLSLEIERPNNTNPLQGIDQTCIERLLHPQTGLVKLVSSTGVLGIADTTKEQVWIDQQSKAQFDHTMSLTHATNRELNLINQSPTDLRQWLWNAIWHSTSSATLDVQDGLKLRYWPQPQTSGERRKILRLSATLAHQPCDMQQLQQRSGCAMADVQRFAHAMLLTGFAERITLARQPTVAVSVDAEASGWRGFLGKLRQHFRL
mgnify:CR=1 FL=1|jgi:hypothetical protein